MMNAQFTFPEAIVITNMNEINVFIPPCQSITSLGAWNLNGNSVVVIVSKRAAILANIAAIQDIRDLQSYQDGSSIDNARVQMASVARYFFQYQYLFTAEEDDVYAVVVTGMRHGNVGFPEATEFIHDKIAQHEIPLRKVTYECYFSGEPLGPADAAVIVDFSDPDGPQVWVNDTRVTKPELPVTK